MADQIIGQIAIEEQPGSPKYRFAGNRAECLRTYKGRFLDLLARRPAAGTKMPDTGNLTVESVEIEPIAGDGVNRVGLMTVTLSDEDQAEGDNPEKPIYEVDWLEVERDIKTHPRYRTGAASALTNTDRAAILMWETEPDYVKRAGYQFLNPVTNATVTLSTNAQHLALRLLRGQTSYTTHVPVTRKVSYPLSIPQTNPCDKIQADKPFAAAPDDYEWISSADRATRTGKRGKWQRQQECIGADEIDADIYEEEA